MIELHELPLVYVAAPYSTGDPVVNTNRAIRFAGTLVDRNRCVPIVPHLTHLWHLVEPRDVEFWYSYDLAILARCDAMFVLAGPSRGVELEIAFARARSIPMFDTIAELNRWLP